MATLLGAFIAFRKSTVAAAYALEDKMDEAKFVPCVQGGDHDGWVRESQKAFTAAGFTTAPVVQVNDQTVTGTGGKTLTPAALRTLVDKAVKEAVAHPSATPSPTASA